MARRQRSDILSIFLVSIQAEGLLKTDASELSISDVPFSSRSALSRDPSRQSTLSDRHSYDADAIYVSH